jgi:hypothetical protein
MLCTLFPSCLLRTLRLQSAASERRRPTDCAPLHAMIIPPDDPTTARTGHVDRERGFGSFVSDPPPSFLTIFPDHATVRQTLLTWYILYYLRLVLVVKKTFTR